MIALFSMTAALHIALTARFVWTVYAAPLAN